MTGGRDSKFNSLDSVESTKEGFTFELLKPMPVAREAIQLTQAIFQSDSESIFVLTN